MKKNIDIPDGIRWDLEKLAVEAIVGRLAVQCAFGITPLKLFLA